MKHSALLWLLLSGSLPLFCQLDSNSVTVTPSRNLTAVPDQFSYLLSVCGPVTSTLDDALAQVPGLGLTSGAFSSVSNQAIIGASNVVNVNPGLCWALTYTAPIAKSKDTIATLTTLKTSIAKNNAAWSLAFSVSGAQVSTAAQPACVVADLMADAKTRAQALASAAGLTLGPVLAVSGYAGSNTVCSMTVKFGLTRF